MLFRHKAKVQHNGTLYLGINKKEAELFLVNGFDIIDCKDYLYIFPPKENAKSRKFTVYKNSIFIHLPIDYVSYYKEDVIIECQYNLKYDIVEYIMIKKVKYYEEH